MRTKILTALACALFATIATGYKFVIIPSPFEPRKPWHRCLQHNRPHIPSIYEHTIIKHAENLVEFYEGGHSDEDEDYFDDFDNDDIDYDGDSS
jgi:hypothetical protein